MLGPSLDEDSDKVQIIIGNGIRSMGRTMLPSYHKVLIL